MIVSPHVTGGGSPFHIPSDLQGLTVKRYPYPLPQDTSDLAPHLGSACNVIRNVFQSEQIASGLLPISGGPVYVLRHLKERVVSTRDAAEILRLFNNSTECKEVWARGAKY